MGASSDNLAAAGIAPEAAKIIGERIGSVTLTGTTQGTAAALVPTVNIVTAAASQTGGILPNHNIGRTQEVVNTSGTTAVIYPPVGGQINGLSVNTGVNVPANKSAIFRCIANVSGVSSYSANVSA
jgi:hypothetical protein